MSDEPHTPFGLPVDRVYGPDSHRPPDGRPGDFPYTRGIHPTMYRGRLWTMRQYAGFGTAEDTNRRFRELLDAHEVPYSVVFDGYA